MHPSSISMWLADIFLVASYLLLGQKKFKIGWTTNVLCSLCYFIGGLLIHEPALWAINILFGGIGLWNRFIETDYWKALDQIDNENEFSPRHKMRAVWFGA